MFQYTKLRRFLVAPAALVAVLAYAPAADAAVAQVDVGANTTGSYPISGVNITPITASTGPLNSTCVSASPSGTAVAGPHVNGNAFLRISNVGMVGCTGIFNTAYNVTNVCDVLIETRSSATSTAAVTDVVAAQADFGAGCVRVQSLPPFSSCGYNIRGMVNATFKETVKPDGSQELVVSGNTLTLTNMGSCLGIVNNGDSVTFSLTINITSPSGPINLKP